MNNNHDSTKPDAQLVELTKGISVAYFKPNALNVSYWGNGGTFERVIFINGTPVQALYGTYDANGVNLFPYNSGAIPPNIRSMREDVNFLTDLMLFKLREDEKQKK